MNSLANEKTNEFSGAALAATPARSAGVVGGVAPGLSKIHIPPSSRVARVELYAGAGFMAVNLETADFLQPSYNPGKRGFVTHFSDASRRRMMDTLAKMDYSQVPLWLDLTYPDQFPVSCEIWKRDLEAFFKRLKRRFRASSAIWKLEFQTRKSGENKGKLAPHFHLLLWGVPWEFDFQTELGKHYRVVEHCHAPVVWRTDVLADGQLRRFIRRHRRANTKPENRRWLRKGSSSNAAKGFTVKHYCRADFWLARLSSLIDPSLPRNEK
jgi:hypothetical protein